MNASSQNDPRVIRIFHKCIVIFLLAMMGIVVSIASFEMLLILIHELSTKHSQEGFLLDLDELLNIFGFFFNIIIGIELFETVKLYLNENKFHAEIIVLVGLIAVTRKAIIIDYNDTPAELIASIALLVASLAGSYYLLYRIREKRAAKNKVILPDNNSLQAGKDA